MNPRLEIEMTDQTEATADELTWEDVWAAIGREVWKLAPHDHQDSGHRDICFTTNWQNIMWAVQNGIETLGTTDLDERVKNLVRLCEAYKDEPPALFRGSNLSERGEGYNAGMRDMARAALRTLGLSDSDPEADEA